MTRGSPPAVWPTNAASCWTLSAPGVPALMEAEFLQMKALCLSVGVCARVCFCVRATMTSVRLPEFKYCVCLKVCLCVGVLL